MDSRYLIILTILAWLSLNSYGQFDSRLNPKPVDPDLVLQVGAFRHESYSSVLKEKLSDVIDKPVTVVVEDGYYKVRITGFTSLEEMEEYYSTLSFLGMKNFWALPLRKKEEIVPESAEQHDSTLAPLSENIALPDDQGEDTVNSQPAIVLQVDVFHNKSEAMEARKKIITNLNLPVEVVQEWEYFKVFVTGFQSSEEAEKYYSALAKLGYPKISLIKNYSKR